MKLSAAIRIGSMTTKQIQHKATDGGNGRCAIGAAIDATGTKVCDLSWIDQSTKLFPILDEAGLSLLCRIVNMNDMEGRSREEISDYVEGYERELEHDGYLTTGVKQLQGVK